MLDSLESVRETDLAAAAHDSVQRFDAVHAVPEQIGVMLLDVTSGRVVSQPSTCPTCLSLESEPTSSMNRIDEDENTGVSVASAWRKIAITSASDAAAGLSMNTGLPLAMARNCSRCGRPSTLSNKNASDSSASCLQRIDDRHAFLAELLRRSPATDRGWREDRRCRRERRPSLRLSPAARSPFGSLIRSVNAITCDVSQPTMPARITPSFASATSQTQPTQPTQNQ